MCAVLIEHTAGKLPFWLSPRQCVVLPISDKFNAYAAEVTDALRLEGEAEETPHPSGSSLQASFVTSLLLAFARRLPRVSRRF